MRDDTAMGGAMTPTERELLQAAIKNYGAGKQILKALEEMTELSAELWTVFKALQEARRMDVKPFVDQTNCGWERVQDEIADVRIMLDQLELIFGDTSDYRKAKLDRLKDRIENK